jgi:SAM-dependent methyltransferase
MTKHPEVENELVQDASSVWVLKNHENIGYSEGADAERYLHTVLSGARDLGTRSVELESHIKDWSSEYHLTRKRAQLLSGFHFDRSLKVLEVGCGCGAITRALGERFDEVVSVEGSIARARLARLRTRDLPNVSIICAPFQSIRFTGRFDLIVCVGVYEYSASFVDGADPYDTVLSYFSDMLKPDGMVLVAIENQFGLKYFSSSREDHLATMFEGIEGYHAHPGKVRTFGRVELESNLRRHFSAVQFFYPYPDYKIPNCVIGDEMLKNGRAGELVSQLRSRDYGGELTPLFDESLATLELARNGALPFFANSFLAIAGKSELHGIDFEQQAIIFSNDRKEEFSTCTRIVGDANGPLRSVKTLMTGAARVDEGRMGLRRTESPWVDAQSLQTLVRARCHSRSARLEQIFEPCKAWVALLMADSSAEAGVQWLRGEHVDSIWPNVYPFEGRVELVDREWVWSERIRLNSVIIRAIYNFLSKFADGRNAPAALQASNGATLIREIAATLGVAVEPADFDGFIELECGLQDAAYGFDTARYAKYLRWYLAHRPSVRAVRSMRLALRRVGRKFASRLRRFR